MRSAESIRPTPDESSAIERAFDDFAVRAGLAGSVFRMTAEIAVRRGAKVVCRTARGIETGVVLGSLRHASDTEGQASGRILRVMTPEDHLLWSHLQTAAEDAHSRCIELLARLGCAVPLTDVEPLLDGKTLFFHFLTEPTASTAVDLDAHLDKLAEEYRQTVAASRFAQLLEHGCGPGCGTDKATRGCGTAGGCSICKAPCTTKAK
ncbi:MAG: PSP1 C-terminal domain-containing protein [Pirellulales bacterium]